MMWAEFAGQTLEFAWTNGLTVALDETLAGILSLVDQLEVSHKGGKLHGRLFPAAVVILPDSKLQIVERDKVLLPPDGNRISGRPAACAGLHQWDCPPEIETCRVELVAAGVSLDPVQIDLYAVGVLCCRLVSGDGPSGYLRSPRVKSRVPTPLRPLLERSLGLEGRAPFPDATSFADALRKVREHIADGDSPAEVTQIFDPKTAETSDSDGVPSAPKEELASLPLDTSILPFSRLGHFEVQRRIGGGGMGEVYLGYERDLDRRVAIKVLPVDLARQPDFIQRFRAEATAAAKLIHPNIIQIYFIGEDAGRHFFAMQYVEGESLAELLQRRGRLDVAETLAVAEQLLAGLGAAHEQGLIHRDIKPGNILLNRQNRRALLADFGLVKSLDADFTGPTVTGTVMGTADYISPEQGRGQPVDARSDLYSLGVLLYQMLSGRLPFDATSVTALIFQHVYEPPPDIRQFVPNLPTTFVEIISRLLAKDPRDRYPDCATLLADLRAHRSSQTESSANSTDFPVVGPDSDFTDLPVDLLAPEGPGGWWGGLRDRCRSLFRRRAPELLGRLQNTRQQIDGAIDAYRRRVAAQEANVREAESILAELKARLADSPPDEVAQSDLRRLVEEQEHQLGGLRLQVAEARAKLLTLRNQHDALQARLKAAQAGAHLDGQRPVRERRPLWQQGVIVSIVAVIILSFINIARKVWTPGTTDKKSLATRTDSSAPATENRPDNRVFQAIPGINTLRDVATCVAVASGSGIRQIAVGYADGKVGVYSGSMDYSEASRRVFSEPRPLEVGDAPIVGLAFSNDGKRLAIADDQHGVQVWELPRGRIYRRLTGASKNVETLQFSDDDQQLLGGVSGAGIVTWNLSDGKQISTLAPNTLRNGVASFVPAHEDEEIVVGSNLNNYEGSVAIWNTAQKTEVEWFETAKKRTFKVAILSSTNQLVGLTAVARGQKSDKCFKVWERGNRQPIREFGEGIIQADFSADGRLAMSSGDEGTVTLWDVEQGRAIQKLTGHHGTVMYVAMARSGKWGVSIGYDNALRQWDFTPPSDSQMILDNLKSGVQSVAFSRDGEDLMFGGSFGTQFAERDSGHTHDRSPDETGTVAYAPDFRHFLIAGGIANNTNNEIAVYNKGRLERTLRGHQDRISSAVFSADSRRVISGSWDGTLRFWDILNEKEIFKLDAGAGVNSVAIDPLGRPWCISGGDQNFARLWDLEQKKELRQFKGHTSVIRSVAFAPSGKQIFTASADHTIKIWDVETGNEIQTLSGHSASVNSIAISNDGLFLVSGSDDRTMRQWDLTTGKQVRKFHGHWRPIRSVAIADDQQSAASAGDDAMVRVWKLTLPTGSKSESNSMIGTAVANARAAVPKTFDLLKTVNLEEASPRGEWSRSPEGIETPQRDSGRVEIFHGLMRDYELDLEVRRLLHGDDKLALGLPVGGHFACMVFDAYGGRVSGLERIKGADLGPGPNAWNGVVLPKGGIHRIRCLVRPPFVQVFVNERQILYWGENTSDLSLPDWYNAADTKGIWLSTGERSQFLISKLTLHPITPWGVKPQREPQDDSERALIQARIITHDHPTFFPEIWKAADRIPEVQATAPGTPGKWQTVRLNTEGRGLTGIRFRSTLKEPADLCWAFAVRPTPIRWQIIDRTGKLQGFQHFWKERNLELPNAASGLSNEAYFQSLDGGRIQPNQDYLIWFDDLNDEPLDLQYSLQLIPAGKAQDLTTRDGIVRQLGFTSPLRYADQIAPEIRREGGREYNSVHQFAISPNGQWILVSEQRSPLAIDKPYLMRRLDGPTLGFRGEIQLGGADLACAVFAPDNRHLIMCDNAGLYHWCDMQTGARLRGFGPDESLPVAIAFTSAGDRFVAAGRDLSIWDVKTGTREQQWRLPVETHSASLTLIHNDREAVIGGQDGTIYIWDLEQGKEVRRFETGGPLRAVRVSPDRRYLATANDGEPVFKLWNLSDFKLVREFRGHETPITDLDFSPTGDRLLSGSARAQARDGLIYYYHQLYDQNSPDHSVRLWNVETGAELLRMDGHQAYVPFVRFSPDGTEAISAAGDGTVRAWSLALPPALPHVPIAQPTHVFRGHQAPVNAIALSQDGKTIFSGGGLSEPGSDTAVRAWDVTQRTALGQFDQHHSRITSLTVSPINDQVVSVGEDGKVRAWNAKTFSPVAVWDSRAATQVQFTPNGESLLVAGKNVLEHWSRGTPLHSFNMSFFDVRAMSQNGDGSRVITCSAKETVVRLWDAPSGRAFAALTGHSAPVEAVVMSANGLQAVSGGQDGTVRLWDLERLRQIRCFASSGGPIHAVALTRDARHAVSAGRDGILRLWDLEAGLEVWRGQGHTGEIRCVALTPDGKRAISGGDDQLLLVWDIPEEAWPRTKD